MRELNLTTKGGGIMVVMVIGRTLPEKSPILTKSQAMKRVNAIRSSLKGMPHTRKLFEDIVKSHCEALKALDERGDFCIPQ